MRLDLTPPAQALPGDGKLDRAEEIVTLIAGAQRHLYGYIRTLIGPGTEVDDILQEVNLVLWRKAAEFDGHGPFLSWACHVAYLQVLAHGKKRRREKLVFFEDDVLADLAICLADTIETLDARAEALRSCLEKLPARQRQAILLRYQPGGSVQAVADDLDRPVGSARVFLHRIRQALADCINRSLARGQLK